MVSGLDLAQGAADLFPAMASSTANAATAALAEEWNERARSANCCPQGRVADELTRLYTRSGQGSMGAAPSALVSAQWVTGTDLLSHFNGFPGAKINGNAAGGNSSGQAIAAMEAVAREVSASGTGALGRCAEGIRAPSYLQYKPA